MKKIINALLFSFFILSSTSFAAEKKIIIGVPDEWTKDLSTVKKLLEESYSEIGYKVIFENLPSARILRELVNGKIDGDIARTQNAAREYNLIIVNPPYFSLQGYAYYNKNKFIKRPTIDEIKKGKVAYLNGSIATEQLFSNAKSVTKVNNEKQLLSILINNRVDFVVPVTAFATKGTKFGKILLYELSLHHILSSTNQELAKKLEPVLRKNLSKKKYRHIEEEVRKLVQPI